MSTIIKLSASYSADVVNRDKRLRPQAKQLLNYMYKKYQYNEVEKNIFMLELNADRNEALPGSECIISNTWNFYEKRTFLEFGYLERVQASSINKKSEYIKYLQQLLDDNQIEFKVQSDFEI